MQSISSRPETATVIDLGSLLRRLETVPDTRHPKGRRYALAPLLLLIILAKLSGQDHLSGIADWIQARDQALRTGLRLAWVRLPHHNTYRRILEKVIAPAELDRAVQAHLGSLPGVGHTVLVTIDGKTLRGTIDAANPRGDHLLAAYLPMEGIVLLQVAVDGKTNEVTAAPTLLARLDLCGKVVVGDALHTQRQLSVQILDAGGDYLWFVKDNQPTLRTMIADVFTADRRTVLGGTVPDDFARARTQDKGHGRLETRTMTVSSELQDVSGWPGLSQVFKLDRRRVTLKTGEIEDETVYGLTSLCRTEADPARLLFLARAYWGIENGLHHCRDVTFHEDQTRLTRGQAGHVMASLNNLVLGLLRHAGATNIAAARRQFDAAFTLALTTLTACLIT